MVLPPVGFMVRWQVVPYFFFPCGAGGRFVEAMEEIVAAAGVFAFSCLGFLNECRDDRMLLGALTRCTASPLMGRVL